MNCKTCGVELSSDMKFCPTCGEANERLCPNCGKQIEDGGKFCVECGAHIEDQDTKTPSEAVAKAASAINAAGNTQTINLNIVKRREPSREAVPLPIGKAITSMILGILSIMLPLVGYSSVAGVISGVIGVILSKEPLTYVNTRASSFASVGKVTSIVGIAYSAYVTVASLIFSVLYAIFVLFFVIIYAITMSGLYY
ncbi:MAG: zinc ribbon domain-containing protein [Ruminococcaceae bacterium]|nr:zinc ribbon domain-containing protein [Oscillospiraceae bacterium]